MKDELFDFFNEKLSGKGLVFNHIKVWYYGFLVSTILVGIAGLILLIGLRKTLYQGIIFITLFLVFAVITYVFNNRTKKYLKDTYGIIPKKFMWNGNEFQLLRRKKLHNYLNSKSLLSPEKVKTLIEIYNRDAGSVKVNIPVIPSIFVLLFIPLWNNLISWVYKQNDISTLNQSLEVFGSIFVIIIMFTGLIMMAKSMLGSLLEDMLNSEHRKFKNLCKMLEDIKFDLELAIDKPDKNKIVLCVRGENEIIKRQNRNLVS